MHKVPDNIDLLLPYGESLRAFVEQRFILPGDLRRTLRRRGIFQTRSEKNDTIPLLVCGLLSPEEFDLLRECQATAEDNPKTSTQTIAWSSNRSILEVLHLFLSAAIPRGSLLSTKLNGRIILKVGPQPRIFSGGSCWSRSIPQEPL